MSAFAKLKNVIEPKPYYGFKKLFIGYHQIKCFRTVQNKFENGNQKALLVELENQVLFLPKYFMDALNSDDIKELNSSDEKYYLYFGGRREDST